MQINVIQEAIRGQIPQNFYLAADQEKGKILLPPPGLQSLVKLPYCSQIRGGTDFGDYIYAVGVVGNTSKVWRIDLSGNATEIGTINSGRGPIWTEKNHYQIAFVDGTTGQQMYVHNTQTGVFGQVTDLDFPGACGLGYQDGYGLVPVPDSLRWYITASYDFTSIDALDFVSIEGQPGNIVGLISDHREVWPLNAKYGENWRNTGAAAFPFERTAVSLEDGLGAAKSLIKADNSIAWITSKGQVVKLDGYVPKIISTRKVEREIAGYALFTDAVGFAFTWQGHLMLVWQFPTADRTLVFDVATGVWWRWSSGTEGGRHLSNCYFNVGNRHFVGGDTDGTIWELKDNVYTDGGNTIRRQFTFQAPTPEQGWHGFPYLQLDWDQGVGLEDGSIPQTMLRISDDGGKNWSSEWWEEAGQVGETDVCTRFDGLGGINQHQERLYEVTVTDSIPWKLLGIKHPVERG